jgi:hypothetical protein
MFCPLLTSNSIICILTNSANYPFTNTINLTVNKSDTWIDMFMHTNICDANITSG